MGGEGSQNLFIQIQLHYAPTSAHILCPQMFPSPIWLPAQDGPTETNDPVVYDRQETKPISVQSAALSASRRDHPQKRMDPACGLAEGGEMVGESSLIIGLIDAACLESQILPLGSPSLRTDIDASFSDQLI